MVERNIQVHLPIAAPTSNRMALPLVTRVVLISIVDVLRINNSE